MAGVCYYLAAVCLILTLSSIRCTETEQLERDSGENYALGLLASGRPKASHFQDKMHQKDRRQFLAAHNHIRAIVGANNMVQMVWSWELEKLANRVIQDCGYMDKLSKLTKNLLSTWFSSNGLNVWSGKAKNVFNATRVVDTWARQKDFFDYKNLGCSIGEQCMNYAQIVWSTASHVGCSVKFCRLFTDASNNKVKDKNYAICIYGEGGSKMDKDDEFKYPYTEGKACSNCPTGFWKCAHGLCQTSPECETVVDCLNPSVADHCLCREETYSAGRKIELYFLFVCISIVVSVSVAACLN